MNPIARYTHWLHTRWPAGTVEKLPVVQPDGSTNVRGVYVVGDLSGVPLLKFSADTGARAVQTIVADAAFQKERDSATDRETLDLVIIGGGVSGFAAALEAEKAGLNFTMLEAAEPFSTIVNFPKAKPIYTYPTEMTPAGDMHFRADVKEGLIDELRAQTVDQGITPTQGRAESVQRRGGLLEVAVADDAPSLRARRVIVAIGRSGNYRKLGVPGEELDKVSNRLHDPKDFADKDVLVVGGGDSALETAIAVAEVGGRVTLSYRKAEFSRPKPDNVERLEALESSGAITRMMPSQVREIRASEVTVTPDGGSAKTLPNDAVFAMIGREPPLEFFRRSGITIAGEWHAKTWATFILFFGFCIAMYHWKSYAPVKNWFSEHDWFPNNMPVFMQGLTEAALSPSTIIGTLALTMKDPAFYYSAAYSLCIILFGIKRIRRRRTPYVTRQTLTLMAIQVIPLFILPFILLPWLGHNGVFGDRHEVRVLGKEGRATLALAVDPASVGTGDFHVRDGGDLHPDAAALAAPVLTTLFPSWKQPRIDPGSEADKLKIYDAALSDEDRWKHQATIQMKRGFVHVTDYEVADSWLGSQLFPVADYDPHGREYWRASGAILAWPLFVWNVFTGQPLWVWLAISLIQTFVIIPLIVWRWGKGAYCGWICSCGALAETMGDAHRHKMPHGPFWNRMNMIGQVFLWAAFALFILRVVGWVLPPDNAVGKVFQAAFSGIPILNYAYVVDLWWAGVIGVGMYFHCSGRVWCRFACPLAALMHIYARFSQFRIIPEKKKCISCNICTTVCHQGIDVMNFANKGDLMADPECVRCSACVQSCPTGVLSFGRVDPKTGEILAYDLLPASPVKMREDAASKA